jgi:long-chain acyl-CoA synthetase
MLVWFPEGRRSEDGQLQRFRPGVGTLARVQSVPMVPILIEGTDAALPPGSLRPRLRPVRVRIGAPVEPSELEQRGQGETSAERIADALRSEVSALGG